MGRGGGLLSRCRLEAWPTSAWWSGTGGALGVVAARMERRRGRSAFGQLSVAARGAMVEVLVAEYNCSYICGREWCRRQGERHRWRVEVWWPGCGSLVAMGEGIAGDRWRDGGSR